MSKVVQIDLPNPQKPGEWRTLIGEDRKRQLEKVYLIKPSSLLLVYLVDAKVELSIYSRRTGRELYRGKVVNGRINCLFPMMRGALFVHESYFSPPTVYQLSIGRKKKDLPKMIVSELDNASFLLVAHIY
ncbi:hypothetical protein AB6A40_011567 [Gnathostoma spinigerum]|uniref:Peptidase S9A N-terminal domain-containing protein n=1 Tax=Gnathostoma spinigerum TaxID=75299 RepID=A0ABD6EYM2_9BILA